LKKALRSDKVHLVDCESVVSPQDIEVLEELAVECGRTFNEIVEIALQRLRWELNSGRQDEVVEEVRQEIDYRQWCARNVENAPSGRGSVS